MRSKIFRQVGQKIEVRLTPCRDFLGQHDGTIFKQGVRRKLCGVAYKISKAIVLLFFIKIKYRRNFKTSANSCANPSVDKSTAPLRCCRTSGEPLKVLFDFYFFFFFFFSSPRRRRFMLSLCLIVTKIPIIKAAAVEKITYHRFEPL